MNLIDNHLQKLHIFISFAITEAYDQVPIASLLRILRIYKSQYY